MVTYSQYASCNVKSREQYSEATRASLLETATALRRVRQAGPPPAQRTAGGRRHRVTRSTVRTLLIDNYDSFTYNLFHYLAEVNGQEPEVVVNDDPLWRLRHLAAFDNVVLSPGPGSPERSADFGICREIVEWGKRPILGVCLGHQGLALLHGG